MARIEWEQVNISYERADLFGLIDLSVARGERGWVAYARLNGVASDDRYLAASDMRRRRIENAKRRAVELGSRLASNVHTWSLWCMRATREELEAQRGASGEEP